MAGRDKAEPGVVVREQDDGRPKARERNALYARAVVHRRALFFFPQYHTAPLRDVRQHQDRAPQLHDARTTMISTTRSKWEASPGAITMAGEFTLCGEPEESPSMKRYPSMSMPHTIDAPAETWTCNQPRA